MRKHYPNVGHSVNRASTKNLSGGDQTPQTRRERPRVRRKSPRVDLGVLRYSAACSNNNFRFKKNGGDSRVGIAAGQICGCGPRKPNSVRRTRPKSRAADDHFSGIAVARDLERPTRRVFSAPGPALPAVWSCCRWGLPCRSCHHERGALLPHHFTLTFKCAGRARRLKRRSAFCCTFRRIAPPRR